MNTTFERMFCRRAGISFFTVLFFLLTGVLRVYAVMNLNYEQIRLKQSCIVIKIGNTRATVFDCNGQPITNYKPETVAAISPESIAKSALKDIINPNDYPLVMCNIENGQPTVCRLKREVECFGITCKKIPVNSSSCKVAHHLIGYVDSNGDGQSGLQKAYNGFLKSEISTEAYFETDGKGRLLSGTEPQIVTDENVFKNGVYSTIDIDIQKKTEVAARGMISGAVIVAECKTNKIRAMVSLPDYQTDNVQKSFDKENSPLLNKCILPYSVGSAFKPCIADAAIENGYSDYTENCSGLLNINNRAFCCHNINGHGLVNLNGALSMSCNCFFYGLSILLGAECVTKSAQKFNLGERIKLCDGFYTESGNIPNEKELLSDSDIANFGIGQGSISVTPVSMLNLYSAIANGGKYFLPSVAEKTVKDGKEKKYNIGSPTRAMDSETAKKIKSALKSVVESGTGIGAKSDKVTSAGKTATAQTGRYDNEGNEINNYWFCGFFPYNNPQYTVIVMSDVKCDTSPQTVFKRISESLSE